MEITIHIPAMEKLAESLVRLSVPETRQTSPVVTQHAPVLQATVPPVTQVAPTAPPATPTYELDELARAAADLMPAHTEALISQLAGFGVATLGELPKEHYGAFATAIRGLGAKI